MTTTSDDRLGLSQHTTIVRTEGAPMRVTVEFGARLGRCNILKWLSTSGVWAKLRPNEQAVLFVLLAASGADGVVRADIDELEQGAGLGKSSVYAAIKGLRSHSACLLEERDGGYVVLPGKWRQVLEREQRTHPAQAEPAFPSVSADKPESASPRVLAPVQNPGKPSSGLESGALQRAQFTNQPTNNTENSNSVIEVVGWKTIRNSAAFQFLDRLQSSCGALAWRVDCMRP